MKCAKCGGEMKEGYLFAPADVQWRSRAGVKPFSTEGLHKTLSYRCKSCGYLESYAK